MLFSTCDSADRLKDRGFKANVVLLDEASTITVPAALVPLTDQAIIRDRDDTGIKLLVIVGDHRQLNPAVTSDPGQNPYAAAIGFSFLDHIIRPVRGLRDIASSLTFVAAEVLWL
jgi:superfamily I DNA and/or RNA helicase